jgi:RNA polymerase sigma-70 factor (ECF subfamily)
MNHMETTPTLDYSPDIEAPGSQFMTIEEMYAQHYDELVRKARGFVNDPEAVVQEVFIKAMKYRSEDNDRVLNKAWLFRTLQTTLIDEWRKIQRRKEDSTDWENPDYNANIADVNAESGFHSIELEQTLGHVARVLSDRGEKWTEMLLRRELVDQSYDEIADALDIPLGTVRSGLLRARRALAKDEQLRDHLVNL